MIAFVCLDFSKFIAVKMRSTLKPYFLGGCDEDLRRRTYRTSSKDLPQQAKKTALRLDGVQISLGYRCEKYGLLPQKSGFLRKKQKNCEK